jgi:hypothetical protein
MLYLHIGSEKTASTAIQVFLRKNSKILNRYGYLTPRKNPYLQANLLSTPFGLESDAPEALGIRNYQKTASKVLCNLARFLSTPGENLVLSSEFLQARLKTHAQLEALRDFVKGYVDKTTIIYYTREPWAKALSLLCESIKGGTGKLELESLLRDEFYHSCSINRVPQMWKDVFENAKIVKYEDAIAETGGICGSFLRSINCHALANKLLKASSFQPYNARISVSQALCLQKINSALPSLTSNRRIDGVARRRILDLSLKASRLVLTKEPKFFDTYFSEKDKQLWLSTFELVDKAVR